MRLSPDSCSHTHNHQTIWAEEMCKFCLVLCGISSHLACTVLYCFCPRLFIRVDPLCRNFAVALQRRRLLFYHYWPSGRKYLTSPLYFSCFLQALSAISQPVYQILAPKYSERWFDLKGRTTATMIISIGLDPFSRNGIRTTDSSSSQRIPSVAG